MRYKKGEAVHKALGLALILTIATASGAHADVDKELSDKIREQAKQYEDAIRNHDAAAAASLWASDGTFTDPRGVLFVGRDQIQKVIASFLERNPKATVKVEIDQISAPQAAVIVERGFTSLRGQDGKLISRAPYTALHKQEGGKWLMSQVSEGPAIQGPPLTDLAWLSGNWKASSADAAIKMQSRIVGNDEYLVTTFEHGVSGQASKTDLMVTSRDPRSGRLSATMWDANGGSGKGYWQKHPDGSWSLASFRVAPDGTIITANNQLMPTGNGEFKWRSTDRTLNGAKLPDTAELLVTKAE